MAVKINVPGVGQIDVEGVASEAVMEKILAQLKAMDPKAANSAAKKAADEQAKADKEAAAQTARNTRAQTAAEAEAQRLLSKRREAGVQLGKDISAFTASLGFNTARLARELMKMHDTVASDPIGTGASILNVGIDMMATGARAGAKALQGFGAGIPVVGAIFTGLGAAAEVATEALAAAAKVANAFLSAELKKTTDAMKTFTAAGASFAGGLTEMRVVANSSGLNLKSFTDVIKNSRESIIGMGLTASEASIKLGQGLNATTKLVGRSGQTLRDEMLNMGYSYEEQGVIMSSYMANMRAGGQLEKLSREEIARGTREYARDLKVLADLTGKDAKKAMEEAQKASLMADILAQLSPIESEKFQKMYAQMPDYAKKGFLQFVSSGGTAITDQATNINMAQNARFAQFMEDNYATLKNSSISSSEAQQAVARGVAEVGEASRNMAREFGAPVAQASTLTGQLSEAAKMQSDMTQSGLYSADAVKRSSDLANKQAETLDGASQGFSSATAAAMAFSKSMEEIATKALPSYSTILANSLQGLVEAMRKLGIDIPKTEAEQAAETKKLNEQRIKAEQKQLLDSAVEKAKLEEKQAYETATIWQRIGFGRTEEQKAATAKLTEAQSRRNENLYGAPMTSPEDQMGVGEPLVGSHADGGILSGPKSGYKPNIIMHGIEAIVPLKNHKIPVEFKTPLEIPMPSVAPPEFKTPLVVPMPSVATEDFKTSTDEQTDASAESNKEVKEAILSVFDVLADKKDTEVGREMVDNTSRMLRLFEDLLVKQDELKREMERSREAQEMMRDLM